VLTDQYTANARSKVKKACQVFDPYNTGRMDVEQFRSIFLKCVSPPLFSCFFVVGGGRHFAEAWRWSWSPWVGGRALLSWS
jgi:hypothetical protein